MTWIQRIISILTYVLNNKIRLITLLYLLLTSKIVSRNLFLSWFELHIFYFHGKKSIKPESMCQNRYGSYRHFWSSKQAHIKILGLHNIIALSKPRRRVMLEISTSPALLAFSMCKVKRSNNSVQKSKSVVATKGCYEISRYFTQRKEIKLKT